MAISSNDIVPLNQVRARLTELAEEVRAGSEKIITRNGESYVALIDARQLDHYHRLEREHIHLSLLDEAAIGWEDVEAGRTLTAAAARAKYMPKKRRR
jgi:prevent-host-death family protein